MFEDSKEVLKCGTLQWLNTWGEGLERIEFNLPLTISLWFSNWRPSAWWKSHVVLDLCRPSVVGLATEVQEGTLGLLWKIVKEDFDS